MFLVKIMYELIEELLAIANELDRSGFHEQAVSIDGIAKTASKLSLIEHKEKIEKDMTVKWAQYQKLVHELRRIEAKIKESQDV